MANMEENSQQPEHFNEVNRRKKTEAALFNTQEIFKLLVDAVTDYAIFAMDTEGYILTWNKGGERLIGYKNSEIIGEHFSIFYTQDDNDRNHPEHELQITTRLGKYEEEGWRVKKDGSVFWANIVITALNDEAGNLKGFAKVTRDLTEKKKAEEKLLFFNESLEKTVKKRTQELTEAIRSRDDFLSIASHELKTPLTTLKLQTQLRKRMVEKNFSEMKQEKVLKMFEDDEKQIDRINRLVDDMLDITRLRAGKMSFYPEKLDLCVLMKEVLDRFQPLLNQKNCKLNYLADCSIVGVWDPHRLDQVFSNLVTNAIKYGQGKPIEIQITHENDEAMVRVTDHGIGIAPKDQERVFKQFERAIQTNEISGLGLGLYIVNQIVESMHGEITVESELGIGSTFTVKLPLHKN